MNYSGFFFGLLFFDNINLNYASNNEPASHGFVRFSIRAKQNLALGNEIDNTADIIFDYNTPVVTNTAVVRIADVTTNTATAQTAIHWQIAPNPTTAIIQIILFSASENSAKISVYNALGQLAQTAIMHGTQTQLDLTRLPNGVYTVVLQNEKGRVSQLVVKE